jgi:hypothetical protein
MERGKVNMEEKQHRGNSIQRGKVIRQVIWRLIWREKKSNMNKK